jgi:hypothetical protein
MFRRSTGSAARTGRELDSSQMLDEREPSRGRNLEQGGASATRSCECQPCATMSSKPMGVCRDHPRPQDLTDRHHTPMAGAEAVPRIHLCSSMLHVWPSASHTACAATRNTPL